MHKSKVWFRTLLVISCMTSWLSKCCKMPEAPPPSWNVSQKEWNELRETQQRQLRTNKNCINIVRGRCSVEVSETNLVDGACLPLDVPTCIITIKSSSGKIKKVFSKRKHPVCVREMGELVRRGPMPRKTTEEAKQIIQRRTRGGFSHGNRTLISCRFHVTTQRNLPGKCILTRAGRLGKREYLCQATVEPFPFKPHAYDCRHLRSRT